MPPVPVPSAVTIVGSAIPIPKIWLLTAICPVKFGLTAVMFSVAVLESIGVIVPVKTASVGVFYVSPKARPPQRPEHHVITKRRRNAIDLTDDDLSGRKLRQHSLQ